MLLLFDRRGINKNSDAYAVNNYTLYDKFTTALAAGSVNATTAEPVGGARTVTDTNSKISITGGVLDFATGEAVSDGVWYTSLSRVLGKALLGRLSITGNTFEVGWDTNSSGTIADAVRFSGANGLSVNINGTGVVVGIWATATYSFVVVMRSVGMFYYIKGGSFTNWTLLYTSVVGSAAGVPGIDVTFGTAIVTFDNIRVPERLYIPVPLESDGMSAATTDGLGHAESATNGSQVSGHSYTNVGTWGVAGGVRSCSVLSGGVGFSYLTTTSSNVLIDAVCTRSAGVTGIVARYASATDYLIAYLDGTNAKLDKVVAGVTTNLISAAVTYGAAFVLRLILDGTSARLFYNNLAVGSVATTPAAGSLNHGFYTTDTGATFDNLITWARGNEGQYSGLDAL